MIVSNLRLPGQYEDQETGLHYNYFRDYDPQIGRYIQSDPIGLAGGVNAYSYASVSPLSYSDPLGLWCVSQKEADAISGGIGGAAGGFFGGGGLAGAALGGALGAAGGYFGSGSTNPNVISASGMGAGIGGNIKGGVPGIVGGAIAGAIGNLMAAESNGDFKNMGGGVVGGIMGGMVSGLMGKGNGFKIVSGVGLGILGGFVGGVLQDFSSSFLSKRICRETCKL